MTEDALFISTLAVFCMALAAFAVVAWFGTAILFRRQATRELAKRARACRAIVLTYDDGPSEGLTLRLAELLKRRRVRATFFVIGQNAMRYPETIRRLLNDGHEIGNHTFDHLNAWKTGPFRAARDIRKGQQQLDALGIENNMFRPPFGKSTLLTLGYNLMRRTRMAFWTYDSRDSWNRLPSGQILEDLKIAGGGVILMHDFDRPHRGPSPEDHQEYILDLTEKIITYAEENSFNIIPFNELFAPGSIY
ncbi:polysaccharide deacetylase family protein [Roseovarius sp. S1116L3]|uniref:polysaccharide deacetylase family protein n=1 Tax=Roseovarius roseus TaxID=3342636 RepID=UPI00372B5A0F